jgi:hypothetical protein
MNSKQTPEHVRFNQAQVVETIKDYCERALSDWNKEQAKKAITRRR